MATRAIALELRVIDLGRLPHYYTVAGIALLFRRHVIDRQASGMHAVVAGLASASRNTSVIETRRSPSIRSVAVFARVVAGHMIVRFAVRRGRVVATATGAFDLAVIDTRNRQPGDC
jgi:hypothetical protein